MTKVSDDNLRIFCNEIGSVGMMARELKERRGKDAAQDDELAH